MTGTEIMIVAVLALVLTGPEALSEAAKFRRKGPRRSDAWIDRALLVLAAALLIAIGILTRL